LKKCLKYREQTEEEKKVINLTKRGRNLMQVL